MASLREILRWTGRNSRRVAVSVLGFATLGAGIVLLALPGPGIAVILVGLAILATEYAWARHALDAAKTRARRAARRVRRRREQQ